jgi:hypothetical protein
VNNPLTIRMDDGDVDLDPGDTYVVPRGRFHQPVAASETTLLLFEPSATINTGDTPSEFTAERRLVRMDPPQSAIGELSRMLGPVRELARTTGEQPSERRARNRTEETT